MTAVPASGERVHTLLTDGTTVCVRPAGPDDQGAVLRFFAAATGDILVKALTHAPERRSRTVAAVLLDQDVPVRLLPGPPTGRRPSPGI
ncbi:hypothetical protein [Streptomyces collinus]|uniref:hypothetical protein n=1 Tax=Streptomyces collinus TaxID=42684 RepID=UPI0037D6FD54